MVDFGITLKTAQVKRKLGVVKLEKMYYEQV